MLLERVAGSVSAKKKRHDWKEGTVRYLFGWIPLSPSTMYVSHTIRCKYTVHVGMQAVTFVDFAPTGTSNTIAS